MSLDDLARWRAEFGEQPEGWDFDDLASRMSESQPPWDLDAEYRKALAGAEHVLDMGTGGGEHLLRFADALPSDTVATEGWPPNVRVARNALAPHGIDLVEYGAPDEDVDSVTMPFPDDRFDLILNRHESFSPREIARVLAPGGILLTQQVGGDECAEIGEWFGWVFSLPRVDLAHFREDLEGVGLQILDSGEHVGTYDFPDVAALLAYLRHTPWILPEDFTVDRYAAELATLEAAAPLSMTRKRFWIKAVQPDT